jgi:hypothetical protein
MTKPVDKEIPVPRAAADARESQSGADTATSASRAFEGSHKQTADINTEEALGFETLIAAGNTNFNEALMRANQKRTYDQAQSTDLMVQLGDSTHRGNLNNLATQALQNAVETANMVSKQAVRHSDIAIDRQWNLDEQGYQAVEALRGNTFKDAIAAAVSAAVAEALSKK